MTAALLTSALLAAAAAAGPPAELAPTGLASAGVYVRDLEAEQAWYMASFGMRVVTTYPQYREVVLGFGDGPGAAHVTLQASAERPPGDNLNSRLVLATPDAKALAAWLATQGAPVREAVKDVAYFVRDPEGNAVELYTPPARR